MEYITSTACQSEYEKTNEFVHNVANKHLAASREHYQETLETLMDIIETNHLMLCENHGKIQPIQKSSNLNIESINVRKLWEV